MFLSHRQPLWGSVWCGRLAGRLAPGVPEGQQLLS